MALFALNDSDVDLLKRVISQYEGSRTNTPDRTSTDHSWSLGEDHQAPETYIAKLPSSTIAGKTANSGTGDIGVGTANSDTAGKAVDCEIYRIDLIDNSPELIPISGLVRDVYNVSDTDISSEYAPVTRAKNGKWLALGGGGGETLYRGMLAEDHPGRGVNFRIWLGTLCPDEDKYRFPCDEAIQTGTGTGDSAVTAIDWFYGGEGFQYPDIYAQGWFVKRTSTHGEGGVCYHMVTSDCVSDQLCGTGTGTGTGTLDAAGNHSLPCIDYERWP